MSIVVFPYYLLHLPFVAVRYLRVVGQKYLIAARENKMPFKPAYIQENIPFRSPPRALSFRTVLPCRNALIIRGMRASVESVGAIMPFLRHYLCVSDRIGEGVMRVTDEYFAR